MTQTVGVVMLCRDEADAVGGCLDSVTPLIDRWTVVDTGSTDGTQEIVREKLAGIPGELHERPWIGFAPNRTEALGLARGSADYLLMIDADTILEYDHDRFPALAADVYDGTVRQNAIDFALPMLVRGDREWRYEGVAHSYLDSDQPWQSEPLPGLRIIGEGGTSREKFLRDLETLSAEHARDPLDPRTAFYLAQTYKDLDMIPEAIAMYRLRANLAGWDEETFYARHMLGALLCEHVSFAQGAQELLTAWEMRPTRIESLRTLANVANNVADKAARPDDRLFVHHGAYKEAACR